MQVMLMRLMSKGEYLIVPKGTKFTGSGKLGLRGVHMELFQCHRNFKQLLWTYRLIRIHIQ